MLEHIFYWFIMSKITVLAKLTSAIIRGDHVYCSTCDSTTDLSDVDSD